jgi:CRISPR-associated protein Csx14
MKTPESSVRVDVDPTNPGQFFGCCGLLELAGRIWDGVEGWFEPRAFCISAGGGLADLVRILSRAELIQLDRDDDTSSPIEIVLPSGSLRLDWWLDERAGGKELKVWAGTMESVRIARAMQHAMRHGRFECADLFDIGLIAYDPDNPTKKVEPFYFDARRGPNAHSRDVGFSPNDLQMTTTAFPAVEFLCLVGLQRALPARTKRPRVFAYHTWTTPTPPSLVPAAVSGLLPNCGRLGYRFENWYRTGQRKHKAFRSAIPFPHEEDDERSVAI